MKRKCDSCNNLYQSQSRVVEICQIKYSSIKPKVKMSRDYIDLRMEAEEQDCKGFESIRTNEL